MARAAFDAQALRCDKKNDHPPNNNTSYPRWHGSAAQKLLKEDVSNKLQEAMKPRELRLTRPEYQEFPLKVFRDHVQQEIRERKERPYWMARAAKKKKEKANKKKK